MRVIYPAFFLFGSPLLPRVLSSPNCTADSIACDPRPSCCSPGDFCNFNRGIPVCQDPKYPVISGFSGVRCDNSYLIDCSRLLGIGGFCCPIGNICFTNGIDNTVSCVNAYGTFSPAIPTTDRDFLQVADAVENENEGVVFNPPQAWTFESTLNCAIGTDIRSTEMVNASITFNYTGPSIRIHTIKSPQGGVFSMMVDGVALNDTIDTFDAEGESCYPIQFPPFRQPPAGYGSRNEHSIILFHLGPSPEAPNGTTSSSVVFDSFAIPQYGESESGLTSSDVIAIRTLARDSATPGLFMVLFGLLSVLF